MRTIVVDDREHAVLYLLGLLKGIDPAGVHEGTTNPWEAVRMLKENAADVAFLDIEMPEKNGLMLAKEMKDIRPDINIIFVTGFDTYAYDAIKLRCSDYLVKPVSEEELVAAIENLRYPVAAKSDKRIKIQCFGDFEVFVDGKPLEFKRTRSLEVLAYLVDRRGARVSLKELQAVMWEDDMMMGSHHSQLRMFIKDIRSAFEAAGCDEPLLRSRGYVAIDATRVDCDYFRFLKGDTAIVNSYRGEYMNQYSWAEMTAGLLDTRL